MFPTSKFKTVVELLEDPGRWTKKAYARDAGGHSLVYPHNESAVRWCLLGACRHVYGYCNQPSEHAVAKLAECIRKKNTHLYDAGDGVSAVTAFNDNPYTHHADVLAIAREAGV